MTLPPLHRLRSRGFTLIELLVVVIILAILMGIAIPTYLSQQKKAKDQKAKTQLNYVYRAARGLTPEVGGERFPALASVVAGISASEPGFSVTSGNCTASTDDKAIVVDSAISTQNVLYLYSKADTGTFWRLRAPPTGTPSVAQLRSCAGPLTTGTVTTSGGEITDAIRAANAEGDGITQSSSFGIWSNSTNLVPNGGFEGGTTGFGGNASTISLDTTISKFGKQSLKTVTPGGVTTEGPVLSPRITGASVVVGSVYSGSVWVNAPSGAQLQFVLTARDAPGTTLYATYATYFTGTGSWQRVTVTTAALPAGTAQIGFGVWTITTPQALTFWIDGAQVEQRATPTPYIETNGSTASRVAGRVQVPAAAVLNGTQGWIAARLKMSWASNALPSTYPGLFKWSDASGSDATNQRLVFYDGTAWNVKQIASGTPAQVPRLITHNAGDYVTVVAYWKSGEIAISVNGGAFATTSVGASPGALNANFDIGNGDGIPSNTINSDVVWFAAGTGTLTSGDAQTIYSFGNDDPTPQEFPAAAQAKFSWTADTAASILG